MFVCFLFVFLTWIFLFRGGGVYLHNVFFLKPWSNMGDNFSLKNSQRLFCYPCTNWTYQKRGKGERRGGGDNKRNNFNTISFLLFYKEKTVLNLCIYMHIQQILHQYISYFFFKNLHIIIASYQIVYNPSWLKLAFLEKYKREDDQ